MLLLATYILLSLHSADIPSPTSEEKATDKEARLRCDFVQELTFSSFFNIDLWGRVLPFWCLH